VSHTGSGLVAVDDEERRKHVDAMLRRHQRAVWRKRFEVVVAIFLAFVFVGIAIESFTARTELARMHAEVRMCLVLLITGNLARRR
jgi:hypothetical protein